MATYTTLDFLPDLTATQMGGAGALTFRSYTPSNPLITWDNKAGASGLEPRALLHSIYSFNATEGATYDIFSTSYFDPYVVIVYDQTGNAITANTEGDDPPDIKLPDGGLYSQDVIWEWRAPYSGTYYVEAGWNQGSFFTFYDLSIYEDVGTVPVSNLNLLGTAAGEQIGGGAGNDTIIALDGDDTVLGAGGADDINGNVGNDSVNGGAGDDWVRGGKDNDTITGGDGNDPHVNGNIGNDLVFGGAGNDTLYGGQDSDTLNGEAGNDLLSGDLGADILIGGAGADRFTIAAGGGWDWVADFKASEGDRIQLAPGTAYTLTSYDGQVVIDIGGGARIGLAGIASVSGDWLVFA